VGEIDRNSCITQVALVAGSRLAELGQYARRASESGKIDVTAAEGLANPSAAESRHGVATAVDGV
jgi:tRNA U34 5-carboxymethylaminomethyl modifying GTPase MnmE/TrmE